MAKSVLSSRFQTITWFRRPALGPASRRAGPPDRRARASRLTPRHLSPAGSENRRVPRRLHGKADLYACDHSRVGLDIPDELVVEPASEVAMCSTDTGRSIRKGNHRRVESLDRGSYLLGCAGAGGCRRTFCHCGSQFPDGIECLVCRGCRFPCHLSLYWG